MSMLKKRKEEEEKKGGVGSTMMSNLDVPPYYDLSKKPQIYSLGHYMSVSLCV